MPTQPMRCVFIALSPLLSAIVADALSQRLDFQLLAQFDQGEGLAERLEALTPDLAVIGVNPAQSKDLGTSLLARLPRAKILLLSTGADLAYLYEMRPHLQVLTDFSPDMLAAAILGAGDGAGPGRI